MKTLVLGASSNPDRYSYLAVNRLIDHGHEVVPMGIKKGSVRGIQIKNSKVDLKDIDTVTLYLSPKNQLEYYDYLLKINPRRVIFNPGTINPELMKKLENGGIEVVDACTLVMLSANTF
tara:strand:- start:658 stop:1014 length:357 start_codon:yes stop_codon:yes gene_type:complete